MSEWDCHNLVILSLELKNLWILPEGKSWSSPVQCVNYSKTAHFRDYLFTLALQSKHMYHEKNEGIDGWKSRTHV